MCRAVSASTVHVVSKSSGPSGTCASIARIVSTDCQSRMASTAKFTWRTTSATMFTLPFPTRVSCNAICDGVQTTPGEGAEPFPSRRIHYPVSLPLPALCKGMQHTSERRRCIWALLGGLAICL